MILDHSVPLMPLLVVVAILLLILLIGAVHQIIEQEKELYHILMWK